MAVEDVQVYTVYPYSKSELTVEDCMMIAKHSCKSCNGRGYQFYSHPQNRDYWVQSCQCVQKEQKKVGII